MQDNSYNPAPASAPVAPKSSNGKFCVIIAVMGLIIAGLIAAVVILALQKDGKNSDVNCEDVRQEVTDEFNRQKMEDLNKLQQSQRDVQRQDDVSRILTAAYSFYMNNNDKTPWWSCETDTGFVRRYVDETCEGPLTENGISKYSCSGVEFKDPDGTNYKIQYLGSMLKANEKGETFDGNLDAVMGEWPNDHKMVTVTGARSSLDGKKLTKVTSEGSIVIAYRLESGEIACSDSH